MYKIKLKHKTDFPYSAFLFRKNKLHTHLIKKKYKSYYLYLL